MVEPGKEAIDKQTDDGHEPGPAPSLAGVPCFAGTPPDEGTDTERGQGEDRRDWEKEREQHASRTHRAVKWRREGPMWTWWQWRECSRRHGRLLLSLPLALRQRGKRL